MEKDSLGDRMKSYESVWGGVLPPRMPIMLRLDGKAFHTYTKGLERPFCPELVNIMDTTALELCRSIQGAQIAYVQSDEISIFIHSYKTYDSQIWFGGKIQKIVSVAAAIASSIFTSESWRLRYPGDLGFNNGSGIRPACFDARVYVVPESEVCNAFICRQQDATRNSVQMLARSLYSHRELEHKNNVQLRQMCLDKGHSWDEIPTQQKRGRCIVKMDRTSADASPHANWDVDAEIPQFYLDRNYIEKFLAVTPEEVK